MCVMKPAITTVRAASCVSTGRNSVSVNAPGECFVTTGSMWRGATSGIVSTSGPSAANTGASGASSWRMWTIGMLASR